MEVVQAIDSIGMLEHKRGSRANALRWGERAIRVAWRLQAKPRAGFYGQNKKWLGSLLAVGCGWAIWHLPPPVSFDERGVHFLASLAAAVILWVLNIFDEYVVAVQLFFVWVFFSIVPPQTALAGFSESSWLFVLGVLGMGGHKIRPALPGGDSGSTADPSDLSKLYLDPLRFGCDACASGREGEGFHHAAFRPIHF